MKYEQRHPLPIPSSGRVARVPSTIETTFDWGYSLEQEQLLALYEKGKAATWNATDVDWSIEVDPEKMALDRSTETARKAFETLVNPPHPLSAAQVVEMHHSMSGWMLSQFLHGEQGALLATARIAQVVPSEEAKWYAANQVADEARHVEVYHRYLTEKLGAVYPVNPHLQKLLEDIVSDSRWDVTYLGMQILVEGLALAAFGMMRLQMPDEPLIQDIITRITRDEARHVAFGVLSLEGLYTNELSASEIKEREDFVIDATHLLRDRLMMEEVYERMNFDVDAWRSWTLESPFMAGFRKMLFSKIVPNLKRLGLLTPRIREEYAKIGLLELEHGADSTVDGELEAPEELVNLISQLRDTEATPPG